MSWRRPVHVPARPYWLVTSLSFQLCVACSSTGLLCISLGGDLILSSQESHCGRTGGRIKVVRATRATRATARQQEREWVRHRASGKIGTDCMIHWRPQICNRAREGGEELKSSAPLAALAQHSRNSRNSPLALRAKGMSGTGNVQGRVERVARVEHASSGTTGTSGTVGASGTSGTSRTVGASGTSGAAAWPLY